MRKRFEQQFVLGRLPINETPTPTGMRGGALPKLVAALKEIYVTPKWNERVFEILESQIAAGKKRTGRPWHGPIADFCIGTGAVSPEHQL